MDYLLGCLILFHFHSVTPSPIPVHHSHWDSISTAVIKQGLCLPEMHTTLFDGVNESEEESEWVGDERMIEVIYVFEYKLF